MVKSAVVNINEIADPEKNPTLCMSAFRYTGGCLGCRVFKDAIKNKSPTKCRPIISEDALREYKDAERIKAEDAVRTAERHIGIVKKAMEDSKALILTTEKPTD
ncbi:hypothetical protein KAR91_06820 [Candidatus Pacearchaeota archaeon]|nr:hypothetical protein [Candidatus Pacearchaeota archaeon]